MTIDRDRLLSGLDQLAGFGGDGGGVTRPAFSAADVSAQAWLAERMRAGGLATRVDPAGNLIGRRGPDGPAVVIGSHIDSVPNGGRLDGTLGVLAGVECAHALGTDGVASGRAVEVVAFADEEGRFIPHLGSRAMTGRLDPGSLADCCDADGSRLAEEMAAAGLDVTRIGEAARDPDEVDAYVELHIEQGPVLESAGVELGAVEAIAGYRRVEYVFAGRAGHSGATPQDTRHDALLGAAEFITRAEGAVHRLGGPDTRLTFGRCRVEPGVDCVIPQTVTLSCEIRDPLTDRIAVCHGELAVVAGEVAARRGLTVEHREYACAAPAAMDPFVTGTIAEACRAAGLRCLRLVSGAGHDAQSFAGFAPAGMIFVPSEGGLSHCREEATAPDALVAGAEVLRRTVGALVTR